MKKIFMKKYFILAVFFFIPTLCSAFEIPVPEYCEATFMYHGAGQIHLIEKDRVVIGDVNLKKSPNLKYHGMKLSSISKAEFSVGDYVGYKINSKRELTDLYLIKKKK